MAGELITALPAVLSLGTCTRARALSLPGRLVSCQRNELGITWHCTQAAWPHLISRGGGTVLMCGSIAGINGSRDLLQAAHVAAKGAVMALTRQLEQAPDLSCVATTARHRQRETCRYPRLSPLRGLRCRGNSLAPCRKSLFK
jgi:hypothetical protein